VSTSDWFDEIEPKPVQKREKLLQQPAPARVESSTLWQIVRKQPNTNNMKTLIAVAAAGVLAGCAEQPTTTADVPHAPVPPPSPAYYSRPDSPYRQWSTAKLQERRRELYAQTTYTQTPRGQPVLIRHGENSRTNDELYAIEAELNRRYQAGDKNAELKRAIPGQQHPG
jgi:hypothetical protein